MVRLSVLFAVFGWLQYSLWFGKNGVNDYVRVNRDIELQAIVNDNLAQRNQQMLAEIRNLNTGLDAVEERARTDLGMIKPKEHFYRIITE